MNEGTENVDTVAQERVEDRCLYRWEDSGDLVRQTLQWQSEKKKRYYILSIHSSSPTLYLPHDSHFANFFLVLY